MKTNYHTHQGRIYDPITPQADNDDLAAQGDRLVLQHGSPSQPQVRFATAPAGVVTYGWVIGIFRA